MTLPKETPMIEKCAHNFILVTRSSWREAPYRRCSKCGEITAALNEGEG